MTRHERQRREACRRLTLTVLDCIEQNAAGISYPELIWVLQQVQDRFVESQVVNEWAAAEPDKSS